MTPRWPPYAAASFLLSFLDAATTHLATGRHGWQWEANPLWQQSLGEQSIASYVFVAFTFAAAAALLVVSFGRMREGLGGEMGALWLAIQGTVVASNALAWLIGPAYFTRIFWLFPVVAFAIIGLIMTATTGRHPPIILGLVASHLIVALITLVTVPPHLARLTAPLFLTLAAYPVLRMRLSER